jgi:hypothetical protein
VRSARRVEVVKQMDDGLELMYWITKYPWPMADRDYLFVR